MLCIYIYILCNINYIIYYYINYSNTLIILNHCYCLSRSILLSGVPCFVTHTAFVPWPRPRSGDTTATDPVLPGTVAWSPIHQHSSGSQHSSCCFPCQHCQHCQRHLDHWLHWLHWLWRNRLPLASQRIWQLSGLWLPLLETEQQGQPETCSEDLPQSSARYVSKCLKPMQAFPDSICHDLFTIIVYLVPPKKSYHRTPFDQLDSINVNMHVTYRM